MRILMLGAGAVGGYFGGRMAEAGRNVTFLVRPRRAAQLAEDGLTIRSRHGNFSLASPPCLLAEEVSDPFDVVFVSCKAYDLDEAIEAIFPAVGDVTAIVPMLNGWKHLETLDNRFGPSKVLGGRCFISSRLGPDGAIDHLGDPHELTFGTRSDDQAALADRVAQATQGANFLARRSQQIHLDMWEKWVFLAALAGMTCLARASIGDIVAAGGADLAERLYSECQQIARDAGWEIRPGWTERSIAILTDLQSSMTASMLGDLEHGARTEADHVLGDLLRRSKDDNPVSLLRTAYVSLKAQQVKRSRMIIASRP